jgi:lactobin A/cerein 7B family class IIb bacteriocin
MNELVQSECTPQIRPLQEDELNAVSGGFFPLLVMAFAVGFDAGFIGVMAFGDLD